MLDDSNALLLSGEILTIIVRISICVHAYIFIIGVGEFRESTQLINTRDNPNEELHGKELSDLIKNQYKNITNESRHKKINGCLALLVSCIGIILTCYFFGKENTNFAGFVFASFAVMALTIHAAILSLGWLIELIQHKNDPNGGANEYNKIIRGFAQKQLSVSLPLSIASMMVSVYLLLRVYPV